MEKGNLGVVAQHHNNLQALVKEIDTLKLTGERQCSRLEKGQKMLEIGAVTLKNLSLKLKKKFCDWKNGYWRQMKRSNIENKRTMKRGKPVHVKRSLNSKENKWR